MQVASPSSHFAWRVAIVVLPLRACPAGCGGALGCPPPPRAAGVAQSNFFVFRQGASLTPLPRGRRPDDRPPAAAAGGDRPGGTGPHAGCQAGGLCRSACQAASPSGPRCPGSRPRQTAAPPGRPRPGGDSSREGTRGAVGQVEAVPATPSGCHTELVGPPPLGRRTCLFWMRAVCEAPRGELPGRVGALRGACEPGPVDELAAAWE